MQNISYFNKDKIFIIRAIRSIGGIKYYWLKNAETNRNLPKSFQKAKVFALKVNFSVQFYLVSRALLRNLLFFLKYKNIFSLKWAFSCVYSGC